MTLYIYLCNNYGSSQGSYITMADILVYNCQFLLCDTANKLLGESMSYHTYTLYVGCTGN